MPCPAAPVALGIALSLSATFAAPAPTTAPASDLFFIHTGFENGSPLQWQVAPDGTVHIHLLYDYERNSPNRAAGHWHFQLQGRPGAQLTLVLHNFDNIWNGTPASPISAKTIGFTSVDGRQWQMVQPELIEGNALRLRVRLDPRNGSLYVARLEPYRLADLDKLLAEIRVYKLVEITRIGQTVEGRPLEIVRVGDLAAPHRVLLRARAHAWEPGGNWVVQGLIRSLLKDEEASRRCLARCCFYILPMANKDGVARGGTRFNVQGKDLNRNWDQPADPALAPENAALETWLAAMAARGQRMDLAIDLHNDEGGNLHLSRPAVPGVDAYLARMARLEALLRRHTWFTEGSTKPGFRVPGSLGEGMVERFGVDGAILELNANWIAGLKQPASAAAWEQLGEKLREVFAEYFAEAAKER